jgi:hypothetical protein
LAFASAVADLSLASNVVNAIGPIFWQDAKRGL